MKTGNVYFLIAITFIIIVGVSLIIFTNVEPPKIIETNFVPNINKKVWGAYTGNTPGSLPDFEQQVGKKPNINAVFVDIGELFPRNLAAQLKDGQTLLIFWEPNSMSLSQITSGNFDQYFNQFVVDVKAYNKPVILVPFPEMNGDFSPWGNNPAEFIPAWKHIHDLFSKTENVKWGWAVNNESIPNTQQNQIENYYPGANYVDYVGVDGFNFGNPWQTYDQIFSYMISNLKSYNKPIYIFSMACAQGPQKSVWITDALSKINSNKDIAGWVWFNENKEQNWLVNSDQNSLQAFQEGIK